MRQSATDGYSLPEIEISDGRLLDIVDLAEEAILKASQQRLFQRGGALVRLKRIARPEKKRGANRPAGSLVIAVATPQYVRCEMARTAIYLRYNAKSGKWVKTDPPMKYAAALAEKDEWGFKPLLATIETPTLREDGSILQKLGYDDDSGLYFDSAVEFPEVPENPSKDDADKALNLIGGLLKDFPFVDDGLAVAIAAILTALVRRVLPSAPMFLFDAPTPASGKTLMSRVVARIATGRDPVTQTYTGDPEEDRKRIFSNLIAGDQVVSFDNVDKPMQGATLCAVLTQPEFSDRLLCTNLIPRVPTNTTFLATGNNLVISGRDLVRRVLKCRIDPGVEKPEEREFDYSLLDVIADKRPELVVAALTIMRAYIVAGRPAQAIKPCDFDAWVVMVRAPLVWLGCGDPCASREEVADADPETEKLTKLLTALAGRFKKEGKSTVFTVAEAVEKAHKDARDASNYGGDITPLHEALAAVCWNGEIKADGVGKAFRKYRGRVLGGQRLVKVGGDAHHKVATWKVETV
jgi:hypothetical protein